MRKFKVYFRLGGVNLHTYVMAGSEEAAMAKFVNLKITVEEVL
jgi:hypothetical protein